MGVRVRLPPSAPSILESNSTTDDPPGGLSVWGGKLEVVNPGQVGVGLDLPYRNVVNNSCQPTTIRRDSFKC